MWKPCPKFHRFLTRFFNNYRNVFCFTYYRHQNGISWGFYPNLAWNFDENAWKTWYFADIFAIFPAIFLSNGQKNVRYFFAIAIWKKIHAIHFFISCITSHQHWTTPSLCIFVHESDDTKSNALPIVIVRHFEKFFVCTGRVC